MRCIKKYIYIYLHAYFYTYGFISISTHYRVSPYHSFTNTGFQFMQCTIHGENITKQLGYGPLMRYRPVTADFCLFHLSSKSSQSGLRPNVRFLFRGMLPKNEWSVYGREPTKKPKNRYRRLGRHNPPVVFVNYGDKKDVVWTTFSCPQLENSLQVVAIVPVRSKYCEDTAGQQMCQLFLFCCVFQAVCDWVVWLIFTKPSNDPLDTHELTKDFQWTCRFRMYRFRGNSKTPVARTDLIEFFSAEWISPGQMKYIQSIFFCKAWMEQESMWQVLLKSQSYFAGGLWRQVTMGPGPWECCAAKTKIQLPSMGWLTDLPQSWGRGAYINGRYVANATKGGKGGGRGRDATGTTGVLRMLGKQIRNNRG